MKLELSDQISINSLTGIQPEPVGLKPYRIELFATEIQNSNIGQALYHLDMNWVMSFLQPHTPK